MKSITFDGIYKLTGTGYSYEHDDSYVFILDRTKYCIFSDATACDGVINIETPDLSELAIYPIPEMDVKVKGSFNPTSKNNYIKILNPKDDSIIFNAKNVVDNYYPLPVMEYNPGNLPIED